MLRIRGMRRPHGRIVRRRILQESVSITPILHPCRSMCEPDLLGCIWAIIRTFLTSSSHAKTIRKNRSNLSSLELQFSLGSFFPLLFLVPGCPSVQKENGMHKKAAGTISVENSGSQVLRESHDHMAHEWEGRANTAAVALN